MLTKRMTFILTLRTLNMSILLVLTVSEEQKYGYTLCITVARFT